MKEIPLTQGKVALVDDNDFEWLSKFRWFAVQGPHTFYAARHNTVSRNTQRVVRMHRAVMGLTLCDGKIVDHINRNGLDNQRANLRIVSNSTNTCNCKMYNTNTSGYRGVSFDREDKRWRSRIEVNGIVICLGSYRNATMAALAYDRAARAYRGDNAVLNFPELNLKSEVR